MHLGIHCSLGSVCVCVCVYYIYIYNVCISADTIAFVLCASGSCQEQALLCYITQNTTVSAAILCTAACANDAINKASVCGKSM